jgi:hypothetical protein
METNGGSYLDALQAVSLHGCQKILEYLREKNHQAPETWHKTWQRCLFEVLSEDLDYPMEEIVLLLKGKNLVDVTLPDEDGLTLLHFAVKHQRQPDIKCLLNCGASPFARDRAGKMPWDLCPSAQLYPHRTYMWEFVRRAIVKDNSVKPGLYHFSSGTVKKAASLSSQGLSTSSLESYEIAIAKHLPSNGGRGPVWARLRQCNVRKSPQATTPLLTLPRMRALR